MSFAENILDYLKSGGPVMGFIVLFTFGIWFCYIEGLLRMRTLMGCDGASSLRGERLAKMQWLFTALRTLVVVTPLLGLLGTVFGMARTFGALSSRSMLEGEMADGIRLALVTTQAGLIAALPGTFGLAHLNWLRKKALHLQIQEAR